MFWPATLSLRTLSEPSMRPPEKGRAPFSLKGWAPAADAAAILATFMLSAFTVAIAINLGRGMVMNCGCFDILGKALGEWLPFLKPRRAGWDTVLRDLVMLLPAWPLLARPAVRRSR